MSTQEKKLNLYGYVELNTKAKQLELIEESLSSDIELYLSMLEDEEENSSVEDVRFIMLEMMVANRRNANLLKECIEDLKDIANRELIEDNRLPNDTNVYLEDNVRKQFAKWG
jgi:hypothetical protein